MSSAKEDRAELCDQASKAGHSKLVTLIQRFRPRACYILSLLRIHSPACEHCMAVKKRGDELRKRLEELDGRIQASSHESQNRRLPRAG